VVVKGSRDLLLKNFGTPISRERLKQESSNLAHRLATGGPNKKNAKLGQKGPEGVTWRTFRILGPPSLSRKRLKLEASNLAGRLDTGDTNEKMQKLGQHGREQGHVTYFFKFWNFSKTVSQTIRNSKHWALDVQSYATAVVRIPLRLFAPL